MVFSYQSKTTTRQMLNPGADPGFFAGGGGGSTTAVYSGGSRVDKHQIKVHSVHRIFRAIFYFFLL